MATKGIITEYERICAFCGRDTRTYHHLLFGRGIRELAEKDGIKLPCCDDCHTMNEITRRIHGNSRAEDLSKMLGQVVWEKQYGSREEFRKRYGKSYL